MGNFLDTFRPSETVKRKRRIRELGFYIDSIKNKTCTSCKYGVTEKDLENGMYETVVTYCGKSGNLFVKDNCKDYKVGNLEIVKHRNKEDD